MAGPSDTKPFSVDGKTAIVTGGGSGICFEFTKLLLSRNCNVLIADLALRPEAERLVAEYSSKDGAKKAQAHFIKTDVTIWDQLCKMFDEAQERFGGVDLVCPGAGIFEPHWTNFWYPPGSPESKDKLHGTSDGGVGHYALLDLNITHPIRTTQLAISRFLNPPAASKSGKASPSNPKRVVIVSSIAGQLPGFATPLYTASKHAITGFTRSMANLDVLGIKINGVAPGIIRTPLWLEHPEKMKMRDDAVDDWVEPSVVAEQMLRCAEDEAIGPGVIWEIMTNKAEDCREVGWKNDPGPAFRIVSNASVLQAEALAQVGQPGWGVVEK